MAETKGIGRLIDLCIAALETGDVSKMAKRKDGKTGGMKSLWDYELRGHKTPEPAPRGPRPVGSSNFGVVANLCELVLSEGKDRRSALWLEAFYRRQGPAWDLGHMGWEALSHVYGSTHIESALLAIVASRKMKDFSLIAENADRFLARELALCLLHRAPGGRIIHAGTRSKVKGAGLSSPAREEFVDGALWGIGGPRMSRIDKLLKLSNWSAPLSLYDAGRGNSPVPADLLQPYLSEIRFAPGALIVTRFENGHVSRWETGPICYASPMPACVVRYGPREVWPFLYPANKGGRTADLTTRLSREEDGTRELVLVIRDSHTGDSDGLPLDDLGAVVAEHRIEGIKL